MFRVLLLSLILPATASALPTWWPPRCEEAYLAPSPQAIARAEILFTRLLKNEGVPPAEWQALDFQLQAETLADGTALWVLWETPCHGKGLYVFRAGSDAQTVLQMPHRFYDTDTGVIGWELFAGGNFRAAAWNTLSRRDADLAHLADSYFNALTRAFATVSPTGRLVQPHGFSSAKRRGSAGQTADIILSNGTREPDAALKRLAKCLRPGFATVRVYGEDVMELGGTTNAQGAILREAGQRGFVHLEMSRAVRMHLREEVKMRRRMIRCLLGF